MTFLPSMIVNNGDTMMMMNERTGLHVTMKSDEMRERKLRRDDVNDEEFCRKKGFL